jgi:molecular chaperone GrpE
MMQDRKVRPDTDEPGGDARASGEQEASAEDGATGAEAETADPIEALRQENAELRDRLLRVVAEMDNLRKRTERELRDAGQYAISNFARDILGVGDNMRRAFEAVGEDARKKADPVLHGLLDGLEMTERELLNALERHGVVRIDPAGERFDPHLHQAMFEVEDTSVPSGTVVQVLQTGFTINGRVLRPAMVGVSKGGPKPDAEPAGDSAASDSDDQPGSKVNRTA